MKRRTKKVISTMLAAATVMTSCVFQTPYTVEAATGTRYARVMEYIDRGLVAIPKSYGDEAKGMYLSWRLLGTESLTDTRFDIYKNGSLLVSNYDGTNYTDTTNSNGSDTSAVYQVVVAGAALSDSDLPANTVLVNGQKKTLTMVGGYENSSYSESNAYGYFDVPLNVPASVSDSKAGDYSYTANDSSVADVDGDGQYEIIVKWDPSNSKDNSNTGYTGNVLLSCYEFDGTELWSQPINLGKNIRAGAHYTQFMAYDLNGDGLAELVMKTAPGSTDGNGNYVSKAGDTSTIRNTNNSTDYRNSSGVLMSGPEYLTVFDGKTGAALYTTDYLPAYGVTSSWGDTYGNRGNRFLAGVGYFGNKDANGNLLPSVVMCRGYYTQVYVVAYDWDGSKLTQRFYHNGSSNSSSTLYGQGNHNLTVSDVDNDGHDEIVYGSAVLDNNGSVLSNTRLGHGDAMHVNDFNNDGTIEVFQVHEDKAGYVNYGGDLWIPSTGKHIFGMTASGDTGRGVMANVDDDYAVSKNVLAIGWTSSQANAYSVKGSQLSAKPATSSRTMTNSLVYWDGDLGRELLDDNQLGKYDASAGSTNRFYFGKNGYLSISSNNSTKYNACLTADVFGDWREEIIGRSGNSLRVYISALNTEYKLTTLMHDSQYRTSVAAENVGYNQPPHTSYYVGSASLAYSGANYLSPAYAYTKVAVPGVLSSELHFDFGNGSVQSGYIGVTDSDTYARTKGYGFTTSVQASMNRAPGNVPSGYENLHDDQINSTNYSDMQFDVNLPNGVYLVTAHYGSWNTGFGTEFVIEGETSGDLYSTTAATYKTYAAVTDGKLSVVIAKGAKKYGGYINGLDIVPVEANFYFDFGNGTVQDGYTGVTASTSYSSDLGYGFTTSAQSEMNRAPGSIASGYDNLYNDQINSTTYADMQFDVDVPNGTYLVKVHYGSWNTGFGTEFVVEGSSSGDLASTEAATYETYATVTDGKLSVVIAKGAKKYGGYINGLDITFVK